MYGESNMETYTTICNIESQREFAVWLRKLKQGLGINLEGWDGAGDWREVQKGGDVYTYDWFKLMFDRKQQNSAIKYSDMFRESSFHCFSVNLINVISTLKQNNNKNMSSLISRKEGTENDDLTNLTEF